MEYRFTITHATLAPGGQVVNQPVGWDEASISLSRDENYHSLIEYFKGSFIWFGTAYDLLKAIDDLEGANAEIELLIEINFAHEWKEVFRGTIENGEREDIPQGETYYKTNAPIIRDDFWAKFTGRNKTAVDLASTEDLDGNAIDPAAPLDLYLSGQKVRQTFIGKGDPDVTVQWILPNNQFGVIDFTIIDASEIEDKKTLEIGAVSATRPDPLFEVKEYYGEQNFTIELFMYQGSFIGSSQVNSGVKCKLQLNDEVPTILTNQLQTSGIDSWTRFHYTGSKAVRVGDRIRFYLENLSGGVQTVNWFPQIIKESSFINAYDTEYISTSTDAYLIKEALRGIIERLTGQEDALISDALNSCLGLNAVTKGKNIRGYSFADKPFTMSAEDWWKCFAPVLGLGLGYTKVLDVDKIEVEKVDAFYDLNPVVFLPNVTGLTRVYDSKRTFKQVRIGYDVWGAESKGGFDDPQTKHNYSSKYRTFGTEAVIMSKVVAASLAIEQTRRKRIETGQDYRLDESFMLVAVTPLDDTYIPETQISSGAVDLIYNLMHNIYRYNVTHTPSRMFNRWLNFLSGCLFPGEEYKFDSGEGNVIMSSTLDAAHCENEYREMTENQNIVRSDNPLFVNEIYKGVIPMDFDTYQTILANRKKAIAISATDEDYLPYHILDFDYSIVGGEAKVELLLGSKTPVPL